MRGLVQTISPSDAFPAVGGAPACREFLSLVFGPGTARQVPNSPRFSAGNATRSYCWADMWPHEMVENS